MERRGFFSWLAGAAAGLFGAPIAASAAAYSNGTARVRADSQYEFRVAFGGPILPSEESLADVSGRHAWLLGYEIGVLEQHLSRTECGFKMKVHPRNIEQVKLQCMVSGRSVRHVRLENEFTAEIQVPGYRPGHCAKIFKSWGNRWDNLVRTIRQEDAANL